MSKSQRPISEKLDQAIADVKAMVAGEMPIKEDLLRWIWIVDDLMAKHPDARITDLIPACLDTLAYVA